MIPLTPRNEDGAPLTAEAMRTGSELILPTHNFCDATTWYTTSSRVTDDPLTDSGDGLTWTSGEVWIDMTHGKLFDEDALCADVAHGYAVTVKVDGVVKTPRGPFAESGGDYTVDYATGAVTFASSQAGKAVLASYSKKVNSKFKIIPDAGARVDIETVKVQFSADVALHDSVIFEVWAYNPYDLPNKIVVNRTAYKTMANFFEESLSMGRDAPAIGGESRGSTQALHILTFAYRTIRSVRDSQGVELHVYLENNTPFTGSRGSATFFCTVRDE